MHDYAIFGHSRATIGRWLGVSSVILTGSVSSLLVWLYEATNIEAFATAIITPAIIYFVLHYCFDRFGWKIPFFSIPNISGIWSVKGETLNEDGSTKYNWVALLASSVAYLRFSPSSASKASAKLTAFSERYLKNIKAEDVITELVCAHLAT